jgi:hypothetical protein
MERLNLKKLNEVEDEKQHQVTISNLFAASENSEDDMHIHTAWETITENIKISAKESLGY